MKESGYQKKIINKIKENGGVAINGNYTTAGEADLQCGIPIEIPSWKHKNSEDTQPRYTTKKILVYCGIEVKTEADYYRVMRSIDVDYNVTNPKGLKKHEPLQMAKIRQTRSKGGLALVAWNYEQVMEYVNGTV